MIMASHAIFIAISSSCFSSACGSLKQSRLRTFCNFLLQLQKTCTEHFVSQNCMSGCSLFLEFGEETCIIGIQPFRCHQAHYPVAVALAFPERYDLLFINLLYLIIDLERDLFPCIKYLKILQRMEAYLGVGRSLLWGRSSLPDDQFSIPDI